MLVYAEKLLIYHHIIVLNFATKAVTYNLIAYINAC